MEGKRKSGEVKIEKCFHYFTIGGGQFSLNTQWGPLQLQSNFELQYTYIIYISICGEEISSVLDFKAKKFSRTQRSTFFTTVFFYVNIKNELLRRSFIFLWVEN